MNTDVSKISQYNKLITENILLIWI